MGEPNLANLFLSLKRRAGRSALLEEPRLDPRCSEDSVSSEMLDCRAAGSSPRRIMRVASLFTRRTLLAGLGIALAGRSYAQPVGPGSLVYYGGQAGRLTMARDDLGGNPFASGFVDVLAGQPGVALRDFGAHLAAATWRRSRGNQSAEAPRSVPPIAWSFSARPDETRIALVLANSDYSVSGAPSLPGAKFDLERVSDALEGVGFRTLRLLDADQEGVRRTLSEFASASSGADVSVVYIAGHGVQHRRVAYWLMGDFPEALGAEGLAAHAVSLDEIRSSACARMLNLVFFSPCRNDPFVGR